MSKASLKAVNLDLPDWMVLQLDKEAERLGINRKAMINVLLAEALKLHRQASNDRSDNDSYVKANEQSFASEWSSSEDEEAFRDL